MSLLGFGENAAEVAAKWLDAAITGIWIDGANDEELSDEEIAERNAQFEAALAESQAWLDQQTTKS